MNAIRNGQTTEELRSDNEAFRERLLVAEGTFGVIRQGEVDSPISRTPQGPRVFTLTDAYTPYRTFVEEMQHGAATLSADGTILFCNASFPALLRTPIERVVGSAWQALVAKESADASTQLLIWAAEARTSGELTLLAADGALVPVAVSAHPLHVDGIRTTCMVITDLTERKRVEAEARKLAAIVAATEHGFKSGSLASLLASAPNSPSESLPEFELPDPRPSTATRFAQCAAASVLAIGSLVLLGWLFDLTALKSLSASLVSMKPNTALAFLFAGAGCLLATLDRTNPRLLRWKNAAAVAAIALGALTLAEWAFAVDLGIDQLLFRDEPFGIGTVFPGRMTVWTALNFVLYGAALLLLDVRGKAGPATAQTLSLLGSCPALLSFLGYLTGVRELFGAGLQPHIAVHTNVAFGLLTVGILAARWGVVSGQMAFQRYAIPAIAVALAFLVRWALWPVMGPDNPFLIHLPAIFFAAWLGGFQAGLLASLLSAFGIALFFIEPRGALMIAEPTKQLGMSLFVLLGAGLSFFVDRARQLERARLNAMSEVRSSQATSAYYRSLIEANLDPMVIKGSEGKIIDFNRAAEIATGRTRAELIGSEFSDYFTEPDKARNLYQTVQREGWVRDVPLEMRHRDGRTTPVLYNAAVYRDKAGNAIGVVATVRDISERVERKKELRKIEWLLSGAEDSHEARTTSEQPYGDLVQLNTCRLLANEAGSAVLRSLTHNTMDVLETSAAIYEKNGDYALGIFSSGWCRFMDQASRNLCGTSDNREALASGKWLCHESCWEASKASIESGQPVDVECKGGIRLFAVPVRRGDEVVGSMNFGYGDPPKDPQKLAELAERYQVSVEELRKVAGEYESRPTYLVNLAKERLKTSAAMIGAILEAKRAKAETDELNHGLERRVRERTVELETANVSILRDGTLIKTINDVQASFISSKTLQGVFDEFLVRILSLTGSEYGFIDEVLYAADGKPYLVARAITNIAWNDETRALYPKFLTGELRFDKLESLFGAVMTTRSPVIANDAPNDPRRCGVPRGHPALKAFLGLPMFAGPDLIGVIGLANAPGGYSEETVAYLEPVVRSCANIIAAWRNEELRRNTEKDLLSAKNRLEKTALELEAANKELEAFAYSVSHDLRSPLRAIDGFAQTLLKDYLQTLPEKPKHYLQVVCDNARQMGRLIDDLLRFSRSNRQSVRAQRVETRDLVRQCLEELQPEREGRRVEIQLGELPECWADGGLLKQVWFNLLANALKYSRERDPAKIEIGSQTKDGEKVYFVRDNGVGFDMQYAHKLFGVFQRLHAAEDYEGTGIGLALVQRILHRHGGRIWADAKVDGGAAFYFTLGRRTSHA